MTKKHFVVLISFLFVLVALFIMAFNWLEPNGQTDEVGVTEDIQLFGTIGNVERNSLPERIKNDGLSNNKLGKWSDTVIYRFYESYDLYSLASEILPFAQAGDAEAQFILFKINQTCYPELIEAFKEELNESISMTTGVYQKMITRCDSFNQDTRRLFQHRDGELGWLKESFDQRYPVAVAQVFASVNISDSEQDANLDLVSRDVAKLGSDEKEELILAALKSKNPYVLFYMSAISELDHPIWRLASCDLGAQCYPVTISEQIGAAADCTMKKNLGKACFSEKTEFNEIYRAFLAKRWSEIQTKKWRLLKMIKENNLKINSIGLEI